MKDVRHNTSPISPRAQPNSDPKSPILSICVPTLCRPSLLPRLLDRLEQEYTELSEDEKPSIEFCIFVNGGRLKDHVDKRYFHQPFIISESMELKSPMESFEKSVHLASGSYIWLMGDDDFPLIGAIRNILQTIASTLKEDLSLFQIQAGTSDTDYETAYRLNCLSNLNVMQSGVALLQANSFRWLGQMTACIIHSRYFFEYSLFSQRKPEEIISVMRAVIEALCDGSIGCLHGRHYFRSADATNWIGKMAFGQAVEFPRYWRIADQRSPHQIRRPYSLYYIAKLYAICALQRQIAPRRAQLVREEISPSWVENIMKRLIFASIPSFLSHLILRMLGKQPGSVAAMNLQTWDKEICQDSFL